MLQKFLIALSLFAASSAVYANHTDNDNNHGLNQGNGFFNQHFDQRHNNRFRHRRSQHVQLGPRAFFLVDDMEPGPLKSKLKRCGNGPFRKTDFSIGHRGAALQFPEHTRESYQAAARMGAGIIECDVTFTNDTELVCRHSQCDLHTTTNILATDLAEKCSIPFSPAVKDANGDIITPATAQCCTSDISLAEYKTLRGKMDASDLGATTVEAFLGGTANFRTDLYSGPTSGTLMTHAESIKLFKKLRVKMTPELKSPSVEMPFDSDGDGVGDYSQEDYAQQMIDEYKAAHVRPRKVYAQSFNLDDVLYWINNERAFGRQAVFLDNINPLDSNPDNDFPPTFAELAALRAQGVRFIAPPMWALVTLDAQNQFTPSQYAIDAHLAKLRLITWTLERSGILGDGNGGWYYQTTQDAVDNEGDTYELLDVLAQEVGIEGIFSDWPATVTYYANCMNL
jgi:glycerophosphoryl diester phosphodiesterase